jgi:hypothetical protein
MVDMPERTTPAGNIVAESENGIYLGDFQVLFPSQVRQYAFQGATEHAFPGSRGSFEQDVVPSGRRDYQASFRSCLPGDGFEGDPDRFFPRSAFLFRDFHENSVFEKCQGLVQAIGRDDFDSVDSRYFFRARSRHHDPGNPLSLRGNDQREGSEQRPELSVEREFPEDEGIFQPFFGFPAFVFTEYESGGNREIEMAPRFFDVGGSEVDRYPFQGKRPI